MALLLVGCAASDTRPNRRRDVPVHAVELVGTWSTSESMPDGKTMTLQFSLTQNRTFSGFALLDGKSFWTYSGSWQVRGTQVVWNYVNSSRALPEFARTDTDDILDVEPDKLVLVSQLTGKRREFARSK